MRRLLLVLIALLLAVPCFGQDDHFYVNFKKKAAAGGVSPGFVGDNTATSAGDASPGAEPYSNKAVYSCYSATTSGTIGYLHALMNTSAAGNFNMALYSSDLSTKLADGSLTVGPGTGRLTITLDATVEITESTTYCIALGASNDDYWKSAAANVVGTHVYEDSSYTVADSMPASMTQDADLQTHYRLIAWGDNSGS